METFLGIVLPVTVGGVYASFGQSPDLMKLIVNISGSVGLVQLIISTWALVSGWDNKYESSIKSVQANTTIYNSWKRFCSAPPSTEEDIINKYDELYKITETQELIDMAQHIKDSEKKYAYVESMRYYSRACHDCKQIPNSENSKKCPSCGQKKVKQNERKSKEST